MHASPSLRLAIALSAGLACGTLGSWALRQPSSSDSSGVAHGAPSPGHADSRPTLLLHPRLAGADADTALDAYLALTPLDPVASASDIAERRFRLRALLTLLPTSHFDRLFATLATRVGAAEASLRDLAFEIWLERDASAAARWAAALAPGDAVDAAGRARYAADAALVWADSAFDAAYAWAVALSDTALAHDLARKLLSKLAATDPRRALALAEEGADGTFDAREAVFAIWIEHDPAAAFQTLGATVYQSPGSTWKYKDTLARWVKSDARAALAWITSGAVPENSAGSSLFNTTLIAVSKDSAASEALASALVERKDLPDSFKRLRQLLGMWNKTAPRAVHAWLDAHADHPLRLDLIDTVLLYYGPPEQAHFNLSLAMRLPEGKKRDAHVAKAVADWAAADPEAALAWLRKNERDSAFEAASAHVEAALIEKLSATDPSAAAARWDSLPASGGKGMAMVTISLALSRTDPAAAARWFAERISEAPPNFGAASLLMQMVEQWAQRDGEAALRWGESLADPKVRDDVLRAFVDRSNPAQQFTTAYDRSARATLIAKIQDPALRSNILSQHMANWLRADYRAARAWLETNAALPPSQIERLLANADPVHRR